jgi:riboflavin kinase/FMN adenylyltransferase
MKVYLDFPHEVPADADYPVVTVGVFDGVHRGHTHVIETALRLAAGRAVALVTFDPHPRAVLGPLKRHRLLTPIAERLELLAAWPLAAVAVLRFDAAIARQSYVDFVQGSLVRALGARRLVLGYNLRLGFERQGSSERIAALGKEAGFEVQVVEPFDLGGQTVSSTRIRDLLDRGEVGEANQILGRAYELQGIVVPGRGRGRTLGIPTVNLALPEEKLVPATGVYAARVRMGERTFAAAVNIGSAPTFEAAATPTVEAHLIDFTGDLYGRPLGLQLVQRLRAEQRFPTPQALVAQIWRDISLAQRIVAAE